MEMTPQLLKSFKNTLTAFVAVLVFFVFSALVRADFSDVPYTDQNYVAIHTLVEQGIVKGLNQTTFGPNQILNRAQAATLMLRYGKYQISDATIFDSSFKDVEPSAWYSPAVEQAVDLGIVKGNPDGTFAPAQQVTSAAFLMMMVRTDGIDLSTFQTAGDQWYTAVMKYAQAAGIYLGTNPAALLNRDDAAGILYLSLLLREGKNSDFLSTQAQSHLSHIESSVAANQLPTALYHAQLGLNLLTQVKENLPKNTSAAAEENIAQGYLAWVQSIVAALKADNASALEQIQLTLQYATEAYFKDNSTQPLGAHLKDIGCEVYGQLQDPKGDMPQDCVTRLAN